MLTLAQYQTLKTEIQTDPASLGYAAKLAGSDLVGVANLLATTNSAWSYINPIIQLNQLLIWAGSGPFQKLQDYANNTANIAGLRSVCMTAIALLNGSASFIDMSITSNQNMLNSLVSNNILSATDQANFVTMQTVSPCTRAQYILKGNYTTTDADVRFALSI